MNYKYYILFLSICVLLRFSINLYKYFRIKKLHDKYLIYISDNNYKFAQYKREIIDLFKEAGLKDFGVMHQEFMGYGHFANMTISGFDNMTSKRVDVAQNVNMRFNEAIGVFRKRYVESFNPIFWIEYALKLPQYLFEFFGVLPEKVVVKIFLVIYWVIAIVLGLKKFNIIEQLFK